MNKNKAKNNSNGNASILPSIVLCLAIITAIVTVVFLLIVFMYMNDLTASRRQHSSLLAIQETQDETQSNPAFLHAFDRQMLEINADFIAWIKIDGTAIDYPVVRGIDNEMYLNLSFHGEENTFGTPFMDYRNYGDFVPHIIIYGHNTRHGDNFTDLHRFLDNQFLADNNIITLTVNGRVVEYEIFSARLTDIHDYAYFLDFSYTGAFEAFLERNNAPQGTTQIITLSTCVSRGNDDERVIVQGALR